MSHYLVVFAGVIFCALGLLHAVYTFLQRLAPIDPNVIEQMRSTAIRLSHRVNTWNAWIGFNLSHSLGAVVFGVVCITAAMPAWILAIIAAIYEVLAIQFWFRAPAIAIGVAGVCLLIACFVQ
ncbi:MAG TPA: hypothetical protein VGK04_11265 [Thermoanaerobaculia bacterium]